VTIDIQDVRIEINEKHSEREKKQRLLTISIEDDMYEPLLSMLIVWSAL
jgi:hypothetical protein